MPGSEPTVLGVSVRAGDCLVLSTRGAAAGRDLRGLPAALEPARQSPRHASVLAAARALVGPDGPSSAACVVGVLE